MKLYYSISVSKFALSKDIIVHSNKGDYLFMSLHNLEEIDNNYLKNTFKLIKLANKKHLKIIGDISKRTLNIFKVKNINELHKKLNIFAFRIDYDYSLKEMIDIAKKYNLVINASTLSIHEIKLINKKAKNLFALHNYYPRPETGLDLEQFLTKSKDIKELGIPLFAFIRGDCDYSKPLGYGLPTLEHQRNYLPHVSFIELDKLSLLDGVFIKDEISKQETKLINYYIDKNVVPLLIDSQFDILNRIFTVRSDSPDSLIRIKESREYATQGIIIKPNNCIARNIGSITLDNKLYKRYSGEMMITKINYPKDNKVNVIGKIKSASLPLLKCIKNNDKFIFIK